MTDTDDTGLQADAIPQVYTVKTRKCSSCEGASMVPEQRAFTGMETTIVYMCPDCEEKVEFKSLGQAGLMMSIGLMGFVLLTSVFATDITFWDLADYLIYAGVLLLVAYVLVSPLLPYWVHPVTGEKQITGQGLNFHSAEFADGFSDVMQRAIIKFERHGFWRGFFTPIIFIVVTLGIATAIGMVNYYYF